MGRYEELDSLRGLASLTVLIGHCLLLFPYFENSYDPNLWFLNALRFTPLSIIWAGHEAVILFFILSGFVLSLPYYYGKQRPYVIFIIRRLFRIYLPYLFVILLAVLMRFVITIQTDLNLSKWLYTLWDEEITWRSIVNHVVFIGHYNSRVFDPVVWSLIEEMRISIIFPLLMFLVIRYNWKINVIACVACSIMSNLLNYIRWHYSFPLLPTLLGFLSTIEWIPMFIIGALIAKNLKVIIEKFNRFHSWFKVLILVFGIFSYTFNHWITLKSSIINQQIVQDASITVGAIIFIICAVSSGKAKRLLLYKPINYIGKISYSIYLFHMVILLGLVHLFINSIPLWVIWLITLIGTLIVSALSYRFIEIPLISLGKKLTGGMTKRKTIGTQSVMHSKEPSKV
ncbi:acyltransferase [Paenibacillus sp. P25]|nr:acyltransferase [Paenibacillus sp. P25]